MTDNFYVYKAALNALYSNAVIERGPVIDVNSLYPSRFLIEDPQFNELDEGDKAFMRSLDAARNALDKSNLDSYIVAELVAMETESRLKAESVERDKLARRPVTTLKTPSNLGCYVEGVLKFQSKDHDAVRSYAARKMDGRYSVWVAPVGSFVA